jgi:hypothetical protein
MWERFIAIILCLFCLSGDSMHTVSPVAALPLDLSCSSNTSLLGMGGPSAGEEDSGAVMVMSDTRSESSQASSSALTSLYQEICDQKDVIMACLEEDKCDIDQVSNRFLPGS